MGTLFPSGDNKRVIRLDAVYTYCVVYYYILWGQGRSTDNRNADKIFNFTFNLYSHLGIWIMRIMYYVILTVLC